MKLRMNERLKLNWYEKAAEKSTALLREWCEEGIIDEIDVRRRVNDFKMVKDDGTVVYRRSARYPSDGAAPVDDRYEYDCAICPLRDGWKQFDTNEDAWYFGTWYNAALRAIVCFAEGDETVTVCPTPEAFRREMAELAEYWGDPPPAFTTINLETGAVTEHYDADARPDLEAL